MALLPTFSYGFNYDVFLSFRGIDTRFGFTGHLHKALCDGGIRTFIDDEELQRGSEITPSLAKAIEESRIAIPVFSNNYASSSFCLDELLTIFERVKAKGRLILPVFYDVDPSHVRRQIGSYGEALAKHEERFRNNKENFKSNMERLHKWKMALSQIANLSGEHFIHGKEYEHRFIAKIVKMVSNKINRTPLHVANYPVGLESQLLKVNSLLDFATNDCIYMVGIYGIGGMGKSTLARALYNSIVDQFDCSCFLGNVRENSAKHGLVHLQEKLLSETLGLDIELADVNEGIPKVKQRLRRKKVLLVLDDVDELKQLQVMVGGPDWFGLGSRVIITTRDKSLLESHGVEKLYKLNGLNEEEALELFCWNAFKNCKVNPSYESISKRAITYSSGLPLALEVIGSNLFGNSLEKWKSTLDRYERIPNKDIQKILKVSFDALEEDEQSVFLDIVCCFKGYTLANVEDILHAHYGNYVRHQIEVLEEKSLIMIDCHDILTFHDLIEGMGKEIVRLESPKKPGKRSRLWFQEDIAHVLEDNTGTSQIEIIHFDAPLYEEIELDGEAFKKMKNLRTLVIRNGHFAKGPKHLPSSLRVLEWQSYPSKYLPSDFRPKKLVILKLPQNCIDSFELAGLLTKIFMKLKVLNFDRCECLKEIPDVSGLSNLEEFSFQSCWNLTRIHDSVGFLDKLKILSASDCRMLRSFPPMKLPSLEQLELSFCESLENFPEILGKMDNIRELVLKGTSIEELPFSIQNLTRLQILYLEKHGKLKLPSSILMLPELCEISFRKCKNCLPSKQTEDEGELGLMLSPNVQYVNLIRCNLSDQFLPIVLSWFANVEQLNLSGNNFSVVPECIKECHFLWNLTLDDCYKLEEIRGIPPNLCLLYARNCKSLTSISKSLLLNQKINEAGNTDFSLLGTDISLRFTHRRGKASIYFEFWNKLPAIALSLVSQLTDKNSYEHSHFKDSIEVTMFVNHFRGVPFNFGMPTNHMKLLELQRTEFHPGVLNHVEIKVEGLNSAPVPVESRIHAVKEKCTSKDVRFRNPNSKRKSDGDLNSSESESLSVLKKQRLVDIEVFEKEFVQKRQHMTLLSLQQRMASLSQQRRMALLSDMWKYVIEEQEYLD